MLIVNSLSLADCATSALLLHSSLLNVLSSIRTRIHTFYITTRCCKYLFVPVMYICTSTCNLCLYPVSILEMTGTL